MKKQELTKLRKESIKSLKKELLGLQEELLTQNLDKTQKETQNIKAPKALKKSIAQLKTIIREKQFIKESKA